MAEISIKKNDRISIRLRSNDVSTMVRSKLAIAEGKVKLDDKEKKKFIKKIWVNNLLKATELKKLKIPWLFKLDFYDFIEKMQPGSKESRSYYIQFSKEDFKEIIIETRAPAVKTPAPSYAPNVFKRGIVFESYQQELIDLRKNNYKNASNDALSKYYPYEKIRGSDGKELKINGAISFGGRDSWEKALCVGGPNAQVCSVNGYPIGWRVKSKQPEVSKITALVKNPLGADRQIVKNYRATRWTEDNFETWERCNCWLCGLPLTDDEKAPSGEHKVQLAWMACFGAGPLTKLFNAHFLNEDGNVEQKVMSGSVLSSEGWSSVRGKIIPDDKFRAWKNTIRGESYAWSHQWCNYVKGGYSFVKIGYDTDDNLVYYINHSAIKWFAEEVDWCRPKKNKGKWGTGNAPSTQPHGSHTSYQQGVIGTLARQMNENEDRFKDWGGEFIYKNIVRQLVGLVKLLNEGFPDITGGGKILTRQEKIKQNLHINYKRLEKLFSAISSDTYSYYGKDKKNELKQFFDNIMEKEKEPETKVLLRSIFGYSNHQDTFIKDTAQSGAGRNVKVNNDGETAIVDVDTDTNNKFFELFVECFNMDAGLEKGKMGEEFKERKKLLKDIFTDNVSDNLLLPPEVVHQLDDDDEDNSEEYNAILMIRNNPIIPEDDVDIDVELMNDVLDGKIQGPLVEAVNDLMNEELLLDQRLDITDKEVSEIECSSHIQAWLSEYKNQICEELIKKENEYREQRKIKIGMQGDKLSNMNIMSPYDKDSLASNPEDCFKILKDDGIIDSTEFKYYSDLFSNEPISPVKNQPRYEDGTDAPIYPAWKVNLAYWLKKRVPVIDENGEYKTYWNELKEKWSVERKYINGTDTDRNNLDICVKGGYMPKVTTSVADHPKIIAWLRDYDQKKREEKFKAHLKGEKPKPFIPPKPKTFKTPSLTVGIGKTGKKETIGKSEEEYFIPGNLPIDEGFPEGFPGDTRQWKQGSKIVRKWKNIRLDMLKENPDIKKPVEDLYKMKTIPIEKILTHEEREDVDEQEVANMLSEGLRRSTSAPVTMMMTGTPPGSPAGTTYETPTTHVSFVTKDGQRVVAGSPVSTHKGSPGSSKGSPTLGKRSLQLQNYIRPRDSDGAQASDLKKPNSAKRVKSENATLEMEVDDDFGEGKGGKKKKRKKRTKKRRRKKKKTRKSKRKKKRTKKKRRRRKKRTRRRR